MRMWRERSWVVGSSTENSWENLRIRCEIWRKTVQFLVKSMNKPCQKLENNGDSCGYEWNRGVMKWAKRRSIFEMMLISTTAGVWDG